MNKKIRLKVLAVLLALIIPLMQLTVAYADNGIADVDVLTGEGPGGDNGMGGGAHYMSNKYKNNYYLDIEELGIMDMIPGAGSFLANMLFSLDRKIVELSAFFFYHCNTFQLATLMENTMNNVQKSLKEQIFNALLPFAVIALGIFLTQSLVKHNGQAIMGQTISFFGVMLLATLLTTQTAAVVKTVDDMTMGVTQGMVNAVYNIGGGKDSGNAENYAVEVAGAMWDTMVHMPWVTLNLDGDDSMADVLLSQSPNSEKRIQLIEAQVKIADNTLFTKDKPAGQVSMLLLYTVPLILKCVTYICIGGLQLAFRIFTVMLVLFGIIILFLALIPQLGGSSLVWSWGRKILSIQINIIVLALVLSFIMLIDRIMYDLIPSWGWIVVLLVQTAVCITVFLLRDKILDISKTVSHTATSPNMAMFRLQNQMTNSGGGIYSTAQAGGAVVERKAREQLIRSKGSLDSRMEAWGTRIIEDRERHTRTSPARRTYYTRAAEDMALAETPNRPEPLPRTRLYMAEHKAVGVGADAAAAPARYRVYSRNAAESAQTEERIIQTADIPKPVDVSEASAPWKRPVAAQPEQPPAHIGTPDEPSEAVTETVPLAAVAATAAMPTNSEPTAPGRYRAYGYNAAASTQVPRQRGQAVDVPQAAVVPGVRRSMKGSSAVDTHRKRHDAVKPEPQADPPPSAAVASPRTITLTAVPPTAHSPSARQPVRDEPSKADRSTTAKIVRGRVRTVVTSPDVETTQKRAAAPLGSTTEPPEIAAEPQSRPTKRYYSQRPLSAAAMRRIKMKPRK